MTLDDAGARPGRRLSPVVIAAVSVWALWCVMQSGESLAAWSYAVFRWLEALRYHGFTTGSCVRFWLGQSVLPVLMLVIGVTALRAGFPVVRLVKITTTGRWERHAISVLFGFILMGTGYMALALLGLFHMPLVIALAALLVILPGVPGTRPLSWRMPKVSLPLRQWWILPAIFPLLVTAVLMVLPDTNGDAYCYHLALSERLIRSGRLTAEGITIQLAQSMTMEYIYPVAVAVGRDELVHFINWIPFAASLVLLLRWCARLGGNTAVLVALAGIATFGQANQMMLVAKSDLAAAAYPVAGVMCVLAGLGGPSSGRLAVGVLLLGCGAVVKASCLPLLVLALVWIVGSRIRARAGVGGTILALGAAPIPLAPWFMKNWLMMGDPVWPVLGGLLPGSLWDAESGRALWQTMGNYQPEHSLGAMPAVLVKMLLGHQPVLAVIAPLLLVAASAPVFQVRWTASYSGAGILLLWVLLPLNDMRYILPLVVLLVACGAIMIARTVSSVSPRVRLSLAVIGAASTWLPLGFLLGYCVKPFNAMPYLTGGIDREFYLAKRMTTYREAGERLAALGIRGRVISIGEGSSYHLPVSLLADRCYFRNWGWVVSRESVDATVIAKKMRQTGCGAILYNFVAERRPDPGSGAFVWDDRMIAVWRDFVGRFLELSPGVPRTADPVGGGYCVYILRGKPLPAGPKHLPYLPGLESRCDPVEMDFQEGNTGDALAGALILDRRVPGVDSIRNLVARGYAEEGQWDQARAWYCPAPEHGSIGAEYIWGTKIPMLWRALGPGGRTKNER